MQRSPRFDWGRVVTPLRWIVRILGVVVAVGAYQLVSSTLTTGPSPNALVYMLEGVIGAGLLLAIFLVGIGEVIGGLAIVGAAAVFIAYYPWMLLIAAPIALIGLLFIACGWYTLAGTRHHAPHATA